MLNGSIWHNDHSYHGCSSFDHRLGIALVGWCHNFMLLKGKCVSIFTQPSPQVDDLQHCMKRNQSIFDNITVIFGLYTCACITKSPHILHILGLKDWRAQHGKVKSPALSSSGDEACS